jgi:hypothetical protein
MASYIRNSIHNNELVYLYIFPEIQKELFEILENNKIDIKHIMIESFSDLILSNSLEDFEKLNDSLNSLISGAIAKGYSGISFIGQPSFAIQETSREHFLSFEKNLTELFKGKEGSILCLYDLYDSLHDKKYIDDFLVKDSINTHTHILSKFKLTKMDEI